MTYSKTILMIQTTLAEVLTAIDDTLEISDVVLVEMVRQKAQAPKIEGYELHYKHETSIWTTQHNPMHGLARQKLANQIWHTLIWHLPFLMQCSKIIALRWVFHLYMQINCLTCFLHLRRWDQHQTGRSQNAPVRRDH